MTEDRISAAFRCCGWLTLALICIAAGLSILIGYPELIQWDREGSPEGTMPSWMRPDLLRIAVFACLVGAFSMLIALAGEARGWRALRDSREPDRGRRGPFHSTKDNGSVRDWEGDRT